MKITEAMRILRDEGTAQNRKVYARHGVRGPAFGVSYAVLGKLVRRIGVDQDLAQRLWASGNHDARVLATKVADPSACGAAQLTAWAKDLDNYVLSDALAVVVAASPHALRLARSWSKAKAEWRASCGWTVWAHLAPDAEELDEAELRGLLATLEAKIHAAPNRARYSMNNALIAIGLRPGLSPEAIAAAERIGRVEVDHGETGCKTPDAAPYIAKALAHRRKKA